MIQRSSEVQCDQHVVVGSAGLDRVAEGVPQIEQSALAIFVLIGNHHLRFIGTRAADGIFECCRITFQNFFQICFKPLEEW